METKNKKNRLYDSTNKPSPDFNQLICSWLNGSQRIREHQSPKLFSSFLKLYRKELDQLINDTQLQRWKAHQYLLTNLTKMMLGHDISPEIRSRLSSDNINPIGFRSITSQSAAKNIGENFVNIIVWAIADALSHQDEILVDKGVPPSIKQAITLSRQVEIGTKQSTLKFPIECDFCIFSRTQPQNAIIVSAKTRLKEVFHVGTMWKLFFDMIDDDHCLSKWSLSKEEKNGSTQDMVYVFATADLISKEGTNTQGGDVERDEPRNLIKLDASFFDYVFVSKQGINHVSNQLNLSSQRESFFHELGCIFQLIQQKYQSRGFSLD